jgi:hypothetical protein
MCSLLQENRREELVLSIIVCLFWKGEHKFLLSRFHNKKEMLLFHYVFQMNPVCSWIISNNAIPSIIERPFAGKRIGISKRFKCLRCLCSDMLRYGVTSRSTLIELMWVSLLKFCYETLHIIGFSIGSRLVTLKESEHKAIAFYLQGYINAINTTQVLRCILQTCIIVGMICSSVVIWFKT